MSVNAELADIQRALGRVEQAASATAGAITELRAELAQACADYRHAIEDVYRKGCGAREEHERRIKALEDAPSERGAGRNCGSLQALIGGGTGSITAILGWAFYLWGKSQGWF